MREPIEANERAVVGGSSRQGNQDGRRIWLTTVRHRCVLVSRVLSALDREPIFPAFRATGTASTVSNNDDRLLKRNQASGFSSSSTSRSILLRARSTKW